MLEDSLPYQTSSPSRGAFLRRLPSLIVWSAAALAVIGGGLTLLGWLLGIRRLTDWWNDDISMFANTALCVIFCGIALILVSQKRKPWRIAVARVLAVVVAAIGGLTLVQHVTGLNLGLDTLLAQRPWGQTAAMAPMRMGPPASASFLILGMALLLTTLGQQARRSAAALAFLPIVIASLSCVGYLLGADQLFGVARFTGIARQTSIILVAIGIGLVAAVPEYGLMAALRRTDTGGAVFRWLIVPIVAIPILLGWVLFLGQEAHYYDNAFGTSILILIEVAYLFALLWWTSRNISRHAMDAEEAGLRLAAIVESSGDAIVGKLLDGTIRSWNDGAEQLFGYTAAEAIGKNVTMLIPNDRQDEEVEIQARLRRGERIESYETIRVRKDGSQFHVSLTVSPILDAGGNIIGASKIARDITHRIEANEALRRSEAELEMLANSIPQLAWMAEPDGHIFWYNQGWYEYTGTTLAEMEGWNWQSVHDPEVLPAVLEAWKYSLETGEPFEMEFPIRGADGKFRWFLTRVKPFKDPQGNVRRWFGTNTDVDQAKHAEQELRTKTQALELLNDTGKMVGAKLELEDLLQSVTDVATELSDAKFGAFFYNTSGENGDTYSLYTVSGASREAFEEFLTPRATPVFAPTFEGRGTVRSDDITEDPRYGKLAPHNGMPEGYLPVRSYLAVPVVSRRGNVIGGLFFGHPEAGVFSDATERIVEGIAAQAGVAVDNAHLYEDLKRAAEERKLLLEAERSARGEAERLNLMKDEFLSTLSHELRTPLNAILGWSQILNMGDATEDDVREGLETIERNARAQTQLIEDLLDMSRIISGKVRLDFSSVDLSDIIEEAVESVRPSAAAKDIRLKVTLDPHPREVTGDSTRLQQVFWNLLTNAVKFTPKGGRVGVVLDHVESRVRVSVEDTGIGIPAEYLSTVFERFRQVDASTTRSFGGLGLGLSIVKNLVELHGGDVQAHSKGQDQGATFSVTLPMAPVRGANNFPELATGSSRLDAEGICLSGTKVLVVDDELDARQLLKRVLTQYEAEVLIAGNADEAMDLIRSETPDVIVSDIGMPGVDGYEFIRRVRALPDGQGRRLPAIALTAFARSEDSTRATLAGYQVHVAKPIQPQELAATIASLIDRGKQTTANRDASPPLNAATSKPSG